MGIPRRISVTGMQGVDVTVVVTVVQGTVWMSISPPFSWKTIMEPVKVDELMHVLGLAREDAKNVAEAHHERASLRASSHVLSPAGSSRGYGC